MRTVVLHVHLWTARVLQAEEDYVPGSFEKYSMEHVFSALRWGLPRVMRLHVDG